MRKSFVDTMIECAREDENVVLLMAEVGFSVVEPFEKEFPNRFFNTGIAEQNLVLTAAGMALKGLRPVAYSMSAFLDSRAFEQIKVSVAYQNLPVVLISVGSGLSYGEMGSTHHAIEESAIMRSLPNLNVVFPSNAVELRGALKKALSDNKPYYISYPKAMAPETKEYPFEPGKAVCHREGKDGSILAFGFSVNDAIAASDILKDKGLNIGVYGFHTVKPLDREAICKAAATGNIFVVDEHNYSAGMGGETARILLENKIKIDNFVDISVPDCFQDVVARYAEMKEMYSLDAKGIAEKIEKSLGNKKS